MMKRIRNKRMYTRDMHTHQTHLSPPPTQNVKIIPKCQFCFICVCRCVRMTNRWNSEIDAFFYVGMLHFYEFTAACFDSSFFLYIYVLALNFTIEYSRNGITPQQMQLSFGIKSGWFVCISAKKTMC